MPAAEEIDASTFGEPPTISFILPTLNEARRLPRCLESIRRQTYPQEQVEILVADGGSTDGTQDIARRFGATLVDASGLLAEAAKERALRRATGDLVAFVDADNTLVGQRWLQRVVDALDEHPEALGFESAYAFDAEDPPLNRYLTALLHISDPWARVASRTPRHRGVTATGVKLLELPADGAYPTGANGFVVRRQVLETLGDDPFHEATFFPQCVRGGRRLLLQRADVLVHHDYVRSWRDYFRKKQRVAIHYLLRRQEVTGGWDAELSPARRWAAMLYCATVVGPLAESVARALVARRWEWLLHAPASLVAVLATVVGATRAGAAGSRSARVRASRRLKRSPRER
ncbi:MAG: glycosyltransferase family 2 protein [Acidobacteriota bacterium]